MRRFKQIEAVKKSYKRRSIQLTVSISFTVLSLLCVVFLVITLYVRFTKNSKDVVIENNKQLIAQTSWNLNLYLQRMMEISDAMYYNVIKTKDMAYETMNSEMNLLYESNKSNLISVACLNEDGALLVAAPVATRKEGIDITEQEWFIETKKELENVHFSTPHVQNLFETSNYRYYWVISLSRQVEITYAGYTRKGVLLVDMNFSAIEQMFDQVNETGTGYVYLMSGDGELIYHPKQKAIYSGLIKENNLEAQNYLDGSHIETYGGEERIVIVKTVGYTGWKIVSVIPMSDFKMSQTDITFFMIMVCVISVLLVFFGNSFISKIVTDPIRKLDKSIRYLEEGNLQEKIYIGGTHEIRHLGRSITSLVNQRQNLMEEMVKEQREKRKSALDALQSQINPHFLYNALDSVIWLIECERYEDAVTMVSALAKLFRVSISKGKNIIPIRNEILHAKSYISIQQMRYKNKFQVIYDIDPAIEEYCIIKLVLQPLLENAIYYGVEDGEGIITLRGYMKEDTIYLEVKDNGLGMTQEKIDQLLNGTQITRSQGSGIGIRNVQQRIQIYFKGDYGVRIESELDEGTTVQVRIPKILYQEEKKEDDEKGE